MAPVVTTIYNKAQQTFVILLLVMLCHIQVKACGGAFVEVTVCGLPFSSFLLTDRLLF
jgi:hypothetical protein